MLDFDQTQRLLVVAPHPDDDVIGCGGLIQHVRANGGRVRVVVMSDGAASHPGSPSHPPRVLAERRRRECVAGLAHLGVAETEVRFLGLPDGGSEGWPDARSLRDFTGWAGAGHDLALLPSPHDNHADHRRTQVLCADALRAETPRLHYVVWPHETAMPDRLPGERSLDITPYRVRKAEAILHHASQCGAITDTEHGFAIDQPIFQRFTAEREVFHA